MPRPTPHLFISATTRGLKQYREEAGHALHEKGIFADSQEVFDTDYRTVREKLKDAISKCDGVICLIGPYYGFEPKDRDDGAPRRSYTQLEFYIAQELGKPIYRFFAEGCSEFADVEAEPAELAQLQQQFIAHVKVAEEIHYTFSDSKTLRDLIFRIAIPLHDPKRKPQNLPYPSLGKLFKGREALVSELHDVMQDSSPGCIAVHGLGGVGKTRLAVEYAFRNVAEYAALLFVVADAPEALSRNLAALCGPLVLNLAEREEKEEEARVNAALRWFQDNRGWLLIIDNVDTSPAASAVEELLGGLQQGHVLITSRLTDWSSAVACLCVDVLSEDAATEFLLERTEDRRRKTASDHSEARKLAKDLECLALALEQAGAFISQKRCSFGEYRQRWRKKDKIVRNWSDARLMKYPRSVAGTWLTTMQQLTPPAKDLLRTLSWFDSEPIPRTILPTTEALDALAELCSYSLVKPTADGEEFRLLGLVQEVTRDHQTRQVQNKTLRRAEDLLHDAVPADTEDVRNWQVWEQLRPHVAAVIGYADGRTGLTRTTRLMIQLAALLYQKALYDEAEPLLRRILDVEEQSSHRDIRTITVCLNNLAQLLKDINRLDEAEPLMRQVLELDVKMYGADHQEVATDLNNLALLLQMRNQLTEAEPLMRRALAIEEECCGRDDPRVARALGTLAGLLAETNRVAEAEPLLRRALKIDIDYYGPDHPKVGIVLNNLGQLLLDTQRLAEAEPLMRRALDIVEHWYGPDHPAVAIRLSNLAILLQETERVREAESLVRRALAIDTRSYGSHHPKVATRLNNLGNILMKLRRPAEAEPLFQQSLQIIEASYGPVHPLVARALNNLGDLYGSLGRFGEAELLMRRALAIHEQSYPPDHPSVIVSRRNLAGVLKASGKPAEAADLLNRAVYVAENQDKP